MTQTTFSAHGMVSAPHHLAAKTGLRVLEDGGNAIEAMVAAAAAITVVYPHMNAIGGDNFWLIQNGDKVTAIDACGAAAAAADRKYYFDRGFNAIPARGPLAALTVAGAPSGWQAALEISSTRGGRLPLARLFEDAIYYARTGIPVAATLHRNASDKADSLRDVHGYADVFLPEGAPLRMGSKLKLPALAETFDHLAAKGLDDFYRGELARRIAADLTAAGSPIALADLECHRPRLVTPLSLRLRQGTVYNLPPPTQGLASLIILGLFDRLDCATVDSVAHVHAIIEATKKAFRIRDRHIVDPEFMTVDPKDFLNEDTLDRLAADIDPRQAAPWPAPADSGDTVWLGAADNNGCVVSFIQSIYWEFGSGVVLPETGIVWQNRGTSFSLDETHHNCLKPHRRPFHTIQPALAHLDDGRLMAYGTMGGDGQPQTQAAVFSRYAVFGQELQQAITAPRWLLGRTWGAESVDLRIENRFDPMVIDGLRQIGHEPLVTDAFDEIMGHAGAVVARPDGTFEGAADPRSDGAACGF